MYLLVVINILFLLFPLYITASENSRHKNELEELTKTFFNNLRALPELLEETHLSEKSKEFIQKQINYYKNLNFLEDKESRLKKRSSNDQLVNYTKILLELSPILNIPSEYPLDIVLGKKDFHTYAITLEKYGQLLTIYKYNNITFEKQVSISITNGVKVDAFPLKSSLIIAVAENRNTSNKLEEKTKIYEWDFRNSLKVRQSIDVSYGSDVKIWKYNEDIFMSILNYKNSNNEFETVSPIYKWTDKYFDVIQNIETSGAKTLTPIWINDLHFLAVSNSKRNSGNTKTYSEILKYNTQAEKFIPYQRILTQGCHDIKYFKIRKTNEFFLAVANTYKTDKNGTINYNTNSFIYKFVDEYFMPLQVIPTNGIIQWEPAADMENGFVLFSLDKNGQILPYYYDGWRFSSEKLAGIKATNTIKAISSYYLDKKLILVITNSSSNIDNINVYEIKIAHDDKLERKYNDMLSWCQSSIKNIKENNKHPITKRQTKFETTSFTSLEKIHQSLDECKLQVSELEKKSKNTYQFNSKHIIDHNIEANQIIFTKNLEIMNTQTKSINGINLHDLKENIIDIRKNTHIKTQISFETLQVNNFSEITVINNHQVKDIMHTYDKMHLESLKINGEAEFNHNIYTSSVNNMQLDKSNVLLSKGNQKFENFHHGSIIVDDLQAKNLNELDLTNPDAFKHIGETIKKLETLRAKNVVVGGFLNDIDVKTLHKYALRKSGDQVISKPYFFDSLEANNMLIEGLLREKNVLDLISISNGVYDTNKDVLFNKDVYIVSLNATKSVDGIPVKNGQLMVLLKDSDKTQYIKGKKFIDNLDILNLIRLRGKILNKELSEKNTLAIVNDKLKLDNDIRISGDVTIEALLNCKNVVTQDHQLSLKHLKSEGLLLEDSEIPLHLNLVQPLEVVEIYVDKINNASTSSWVLTGVNETQLIDGWKQVVGDLAVTGGTSAYKINNIDLSDMENNILLKHGDQDISGKHVLKHLVAENGMSYETLSFGQNQWDDVLTISGEQTLTGNNEFVQDTTFDNARVSKIIMNGFINGIDLSEALNDVVIKNSTQKISGHKIFKNLNAEEIHVGDDNIKNTMEMVKEELSKIEINQNVHITDKLNTKNVFVKNLLNNKPLSEVNKNDDTADNNELLEINEDLDFDTITIFSTAYISSNKINDISLDHIVNGSVKKDEPFDSKNIVFENSITINKTLQLDGQIERLDLNNIINSNPNQTQALEDEKIFNNAFVVNGNVYIDGKLNNLDLNKMCFMKNPTNLNIKGNVVFAKGPKVRTINNHIVDEILNNAWFVDTTTSINENIRLNDVQFLDNVTIQGSLNSEKLDQLAKTYLSKSRNQTIFATYTFEDEVLFVKDLISPIINTTGNINEINFSAFLQTVLLNNTDQIFETPVFIENFITGVVNGEYKVNDLDLESQVMRYDVENIVTGKKSFESMKVNTLHIKDHLEVQKIALAKWLRNVLQKEGAYQVQGNYTFNVPPTFESGISLKGTLNDINFNKDNIMMADIPQEITGQKTFKSDPLDPIHFKSVKIKKGAINGVFFSELMSNEARLDKDSTFESPMKFHNNITVDNININKLYNGVNVTELLKNISSLNSLNNFDDNYYDLKMMAQKIQTSLENQAYFLNYFKLVMTLIKTNHIMGMTLEDNIDIMLTFSNRSNILEVGKFVLNPDAVTILPQDVIVMGSYPNVIVKVKLGNKDMLYFERELNRHNNKGASHIGEIVNIKPNNTVDILYKFINNGSQFVSSFHLTSINEDCLAFIDLSETNIQIACENNGNIHYLPPLSHRTAHELQFMNILNETYMVVISHEFEHKASCTEILKFDPTSLEFKSQQIIYEDKPKAVHSILYNGQHYLAVVSGHMQNTMIFGEVTIRRFNFTSKQFEVWQVLNLKAPHKVQFSILPSNELVLYVLTESPTEPFIVYIYNGISGFTEIIKGSTVPKARYLKTFTLNNNVFVATVHKDEISIMQGIFKGNKLLL
ncbi:unnamed protein product [Brassicogethes aeneus]|uniref:Uncharacterized protein n=1 Tax=Brassicogethes aeneus TaxID=1431903 RepID=A0A9P0FM10_BRAAE|nr:unnamed protein product [Brassicogethes aeneus]